MHVTPFDVPVGSEVSSGTKLGDTQLWTRVNSLDSPWVLDDLTRIVTEIGDRVDVVMVPKVEGPWDIHYIDQLLAQVENKDAESILGENGLAVLLRRPHQIRPDGHARAGLGGEVPNRLGAEERARASRGPDYGREKFPRREPHATFAAASVPGSAFACAGVAAPSASNNRVSFFKICSLIGMDRRPEIGRAHV